MEKPGRRPRFYRFRSLGHVDREKPAIVAGFRAAVVVSHCGEPGSFEYGVPQFLFEMRANVFNTRNSYIPSRDGKRFLVNMMLDADDAPINVVQHWQATVK
jgi:hypothetical protein